MYHFRIFVLLPSFYRTLPLTLWRPRRVFIFGNIMRNAYQKFAEFWNPMVYYWLRIGRMIFSPARFVVSISEWQATLARLGTFAALKNYETCFWSLVLIFSWRTPILFVFAWQQLGQGGACLPLWQMQTSRLYLLKFWNQNCDPILASLEAIAASYIHTGRCRLQCTLMVGTIVERTKSGKLVIGSVLCAQRRWAFVFCTFEHSLCVFVLRGLALSRGLDHGGVLELV